MTGNSLVMLGMLLIAVTPTLGFFSPGAAFLLILLLLFIFITHFKRITITFSKNITSAICLSILIYSSYYYGGFYQSSYAKSIGQFIFFTMICIVAYQEFIQKKNTHPGLFIATYIILATFTLITSPHPIVDTVVQFKEAPLHLLNGINPYSATYTKVYNNINPNYYVHLPLSILFYVPFVLIPVDQRVAIMLITVCAFILLYKRIPKHHKQKALLPLSLVMFMPGSFYMLEHMFHDSIIFFFLTLAVYFIPVSQRISSIFLAAFFTVKQNVFICLPFFMRTYAMNKKNILLFVSPFMIILVFLLWNPSSFLNNVVFTLAPDRIASPVSISLTFSTLLSYYLSPFVSISLIRVFTVAIFFCLYIYIYIFYKESPVLKSGIALLVFYFFSYYAYFNSYYLIMLLLLYHFISASFFPPKLQRNTP